MGNQKRKKSSQYNQPKPLPLSAPSQAKASGVAYSASIMILLALSLIASIIMGMSGFTLKEGTPAPNWYIYLNFLLPQLSLFLVAFLYLAWLRRPVKRALQEQKCHPKYFILAITLQIGLLSLGTLNDVFIRFLERFGYQNSTLQLPNLDGFGLVATIFCVALLPAVFEEIFFRGIVLKGLRSFGAVGGVLLCGALFSLYHQNPAQTMYQFVCGAAFALIALKSGSVFPTMLAHFLNNALIIVLARFGITAIPSSAYVPYVIITSLCLIGTLGYLFFFDVKETDEEEKTQRQKQEDRSERIRFFVCALVGITVFAFNWISALY